MIHLSLLILRTLSDQSDNQLARVTGYSFLFVLLQAHEDNNSIFHVKHASSVRSSTDNHLQLFDNFHISQTFQFSLTLYLGIFC